MRQSPDPIKARDRQRREAARNIHMLADIAVDAFESRKAELKGDGKAGRWFSPPELHVLLKLGKVPVADIDQKDMRDHDISHVIDISTVCSMRWLIHLLAQSGSGTGFQMLGAII